MFHFALEFNCPFLVQLIANLSLFIDFCVNLLNRDTNQLHIVCPFEGHPVRPQTLFKSFENLGIEAFIKIQYTPIDDRAPSSSLKRHKLRLHFYLAY